MLQKYNEAVLYRANLGSCLVPIGLRSVGWAEFPAGVVNEPRRTTFYQFVWTVEGEGTFHVRGKKAGCEA